ncbi:MAG: aminodeoxychorismate synthase component I [Parvibaculum sp.]|uniref:aminodeoxychorismate synthase component I n=1 Tax=Parvibaculum sp. TaxID=2024848 RepID=UPI00271FA30E|nr:aminodeoxychorismate synthase component I [Parvibaculum sp.]MDO8837850.1 aminodeoxychorismate synthase component I [Parvibaculum sp.]
MTEPLVQELAWRPPHEAFHAFAAEPFALFLDSATAGPGRDPSLHGRWSFIAADPADSVTLRIAIEPEPFAVLKAKLAALPRIAARPDQPPFIGGAAGFFGYGLGRTLERLPPEAPPYAVDDQNLPDMALGFYDTVLAFDMIARRAWSFSTGGPERAARMRARFEAAGPLPSTARVAPTTITSNFTRTAYERAVAQVVDDIYAGDIFQANLSQRFEARLAEGDAAYALYLRLRAASPAPFGAFFNFGEGAILSSSPERFLACRDGAVETRPIKGTRPRGRTPDEDRRLAADLMASEKDRAENVMIVDLLRNDISRVCADGSVTVEKLCALESFANVHHLVSTIRGRLRDDATAADLLAACFPGGSVTGAPKLRAMEIIAELEPTARGPYCGAIGYLGADGAMDTAIAIRTMIVKDRRVTFQAGGGIVADSDPAAEYEETLAKARDMRHVLEATGDTAPDAASPAVAGAHA